MPSFDYNQARKILESEFQSVEESTLSGKSPETDAALDPFLDTIFDSRTQAYRETLIGCILARVIDSSIDATLPYAKQSAEAYNGRTLDEKVVNPFLKEKRIPSSRGPFLSVFRRSVRFDKKTGEGVKDKKGYFAFLDILGMVSAAPNEKSLRRILRLLLYRFFSLRQSSEVSLSKLQRISLEQYDMLITGLLKTSSGGRFPVLLIEATFNAIKEAYGLDWIISVQGINVADSPSGAGGDIEIRSGGRVVLAAEVTERPIDKDRMLATFQTKIAPKGIEDYLFFVTADVASEAMRQARQYFSQGHEVNFLGIKNYILVALASTGRKGREAFNRIFTERLDGADVPRTLKVAWNDQIARITST